jgi:hypothetical protein
VSFGILAFATLTLLGVFISGLSLSSEANDRMTAVQIGQEVLQQITALDRTLVPAQGIFEAGATTPEGDFPPPPYPSVRQNNRTFTVHIETLAHETLESLTLVRVSVLWNERSEVRMETALCR